MRTLINWTEAVKALPSSADCWRRIDALWTQGQELTRRCGRALDASGLRPTLIFVLAETRRRLDTTLPRGEWLARVFHRALDAVSSPRKAALVAVAAGMAALAVIVLLLEISVRRQLAGEAGPSMSANAAPSESAGTLPVGSLLSGDMESMDRTGALGVSHQAQTFGQAIREPVPLPRPRKPR
jgi:hypothetical protein